MFTETKDEAEDGGWGWVVVAGTNRNPLEAMSHPNGYFLKPVK
jgi:hypothetical protein